jgi:hypothetical protein
VPNRRQFLQTGVSVAALPLAFDALTSGDAFASSRAPGVMLHKAAFDDRYREGHRFAETMAGLGVAAQALRDGDVTALYLELDRLWREQPAAVGGLTQFGPMFVLERLAVEHGLRMVLRVEHEVGSGGTPALIRTPAAGTTADAAESIIHYYQPLSIQKGLGVAWDGPLFSWVIAPALRA